MFDSMSRKKEAHMFDSTYHNRTAYRHSLYYQEGRKSLYTVGKLLFSTKEIEVTLPDNKPGPSEKRRECKFKETIEHTTLVSLQQLQMLMVGISMDMQA
ncbi:Protein argonaute 18 [Hordeum vulgare]|nr:Protein argonaute 18 [Hordeum vulgare]